MQNKTDSKPSESLSIADENLVDKELREPAAAEPSEVEDPEEAKMKADALKAAQEAVSKQKKWQMHLTLNLWSYGKLLT